MEFASDDFLGGPDVYHLVTFMCNIVINCHNRHSKIIKSQQPFRGMKNGISIAKYSTTHPNAPYLLNFIEVILRCRVLYKNIKLLG